MDIKPNIPLEHLNDLRKHLFRAALFMVITTAIMAFFMRDLLAFITEPVGGIEALQAIEVTESISVVMRIALLGGFALALPWGLAKVPPCADVAAGAVGHHADEGWIIRLGC